MITEKIDSYLKEAEYEDFEVGSPEWAIETLVNGNFTDFNSWARKASKGDILDAIDFYASDQPKRYKEIIFKIRRYV